MTRPSLHPVDNQIYTGFLLLISAEDGLTQTEIHKELIAIKKKKLSIISTMQKIKKLEIYNLISKDEKGGQRNAKKIFINMDEIIGIVSKYLFNIQNEITKEINQEYSYWKLFKKRYNPKTNDFQRVLFENVLKEISNSYTYITNYSYGEKEFFDILNNPWFVILVKYILSFHSRNPQYYETTFSHLLFSIIDYFIFHHKDIDEYITKSTNEKLIDLQNEIFDLESEQEIHDYIEGKNNTIEIFRHMRNLRLIQPMYSHTTTSLWVLENLVQI